MIRRIGDRSLAGRAADFFFTKRSNPIKIRGTYDTGVPIQASNPIGNLVEVEMFGELRSAISVGAGEQWTRTELFILGGLLFAVSREDV
jgi:hypothetical protein